jgi:hypothetical protein
VRYDPAIGMFDVSYAAAWELGRLLSLQSKSFSTSLYQWKRLYAQQLAQAEQYVTHLPFQKPAVTDAAPQLPDAVWSWFDRLRKLQGIPFNYLVPDERMLPVESIRFFRVDHAWVECLLDGAFSIGRVTTADFAKDQLHAGDSPALNSSQPVTGFLLRSEVVSGWPGLLVDGYADQRDPEQEKDPPTPRPALTMLRMERLASNVLICLFEGEIKTVEIHQKPETLHFGFDENASDKPSYYKKLRDPNSGSPTDLSDSLKDDPLKDDVEINLQRVINIGKFAESVHTTVQNLSPPLTKFTSAQFALQMVEGVQKVVFLAGAPVT